MTIELYSDNSFIFDLFGEDELLGKQNMAFELNKNIWLHFYGGPPMADHCGKVHGLEHLEAKVVEHFQKVEDFF